MKSFLQQPRDNPMARARWIAGAGLIFFTSIMAPGMSQDQDYRKDIIKNVNNYRAKMNETKFNFCNTAIGAVSANYSGRGTIEGRLAEMDANCAKAVSRLSEVNISIWKLEDEIKKLDIDSAAIFQSMRKLGISLNVTDFKSTGMQAVASSYAVGTLPVSSKGTSTTTNHRLFDYLLRKVEKLQKAYYLAISRLIELQGEAQRLESTIAHTMALARVLQCALASLKNIDSPSPMQVSLKGTPVTRQTYDAHDDNAHVAICGCIAIDFSSYKSMQAMPVGGSREIKYYEREDNDPDYPRIKVPLRALAIRINASSFIIYPLASGDDAGADSLSQLLSQYREFVRMHANAAQFFTKQIPSGTYKLR